MQCIIALKVGKTGQYKKKHCKQKHISLFFGSNLVELSHDPYMLPCQ